MALETRRQLQDEARGIGISEEYIDRLVERFYEKVRADADLGPVFDAVIQDHWDEHLQKMKLFWASVALRTGTYRGRPMPMHKALTDARPEHFGIWLRLFEETLAESAPSAEARQVFMEFANSIAERLSKAMFS
jgi:hemoglobin